jgi:transposase
MKKFSHYDAQFKLSVLRRMWEDGLSHRQTAAMFNIRNKSCLSDWERRYKTGGIDALAPYRRGRPRAMPKSEKPSEPQVSPSDNAKSREELLAELNYLRMENAYLKNSRP